MEPQQLVGIQAQLHRSFPVTIRSLQREDRVEPQLAETGGLAAAAHRRPQTPETGELPELPVSCPREEPTRALASAPKFTAESAHWAELEVPLFCRSVQAVVVAAATSSTRREP